MGIRIMIRHIVGRLHVGASNRAVIRAVIAQVCGGRSAFLRRSRRDRRDLMAIALYEHAHNRRIYRIVMSGLARSVPLEVSPTVRRAYNVARRRQSFL
jgi:hypothetical protein